MEVCCAARPMRPSWALRPVLRRDASKATDEARAYRRGVEMLLDTLLSRCDFLLKSASARKSEFVIYLNRRLAEASYDFNIDDQRPRPGVR